jgi:hypothetical protein
LLKLKALGLSDISFSNPIDEKISLSNNAINSNSTDNVFLSAGSTSGSINNKVINAIDNFASNSGKEKGSNVNAYSARLITSGSSIINSGGKGFIKSGIAMKDKSVANAVISNNNAIRDRFDSNSICFNYNNGFISGGNSESNSVNDFRFAGLSDCKR